MEFLANDERRLCQRVSTKVQCWLERESITLFGTVTNLSHHGLFLHTPVTLAAGSNVNLKITLKDGVVSALGRVVWERQAGIKSSQVGLGIHFDEVTQGQGFLDRFITHKKKWFITPR